MEFLRFGSSIPGSYWGCCAFDIIQDFKQPPDDLACIQLVCGDGGHLITNEEGEELFAGPTYRDIFEQRLRFGTFDTSDMPNHGFLAIMTGDQIKTSVGGQWLKILKENGFEFIRTVSNSVYAGQSIGPIGTSPERSLNHLFGLFRNIGSGAATNPFVPPEQWVALPSVVPEAWQSLTAPDSLTQKQWEAQTAAWEAKEPKPLLSRGELVKLGVPITVAGRRSKYPQEPETVRLNRDKAKEQPTSSPWVKVAIVVAEDEC